MNEVKKLVEYLELASGRIGAEISSITGRYSLVSTGSVAFPIAESYREYDRLVGLVDSYMNMLVDAVYLMTKDGRDIFVSLRFPSGKTHEYFRKSTVSGVVADENMRIFETPIGVIDYSVLKVLQYIKDNPVELFYKYLADQLKIIKQELGIEGNKPIPPHADLMREGITDRLNICGMQYLFADIDTLFGREEV